MLPSLMDLLVLGLATSQVLETWQHGSIFASWRAEVETREGFFAELLQCMFCLSHWVAFFLVVLYWLSQTWPWLYGVPLWLAVTRVGYWAWNQTNPDMEDPT